MDHKQISNELRNAEQSCNQIGMLTERYPDMSVTDAYKIQLEAVAQRKAEGQKVIGMKIGLTSRGMQELLKVSEPDYGHLFDNMLLLEGETCKASELIQPKVEGEIAFCLCKTLKGPGVTAADVYDATNYVVPSIEVVDSRIKDWKIKLEDTIADNGSSARFMIGGRMIPIHEVDMRLTGMTLEKNGMLINSGTTAEVFGNPAASVAWLANKLSAFDIALEAGSIVLAGALTAAVSAEAGDVFTASFQGMGSVTLRFT